MNLLDTASHLSPPVAWHLASALGALLLGPIALWLPKTAPGHRAVGRVWVLLMLAAAVSSLFIRDHRLPNLAGFSPIHLLSVGTLVGLALGMRHILARDVARHRRVMRFTYNGVIVAGVLSLLPQRLLGSGLMSAIS